MSLAASADAAVARTSELEAGAPPASNPVDGGSNTAASSHNTPAAPITSAQVDAGKADAGKATASPNASDISLRLGDGSDPERMHVLVDASHDGGAWWSPQPRASKLSGEPVVFAPDAPHQGKPLADYLRSLRMRVTERSRLDEPIDLTVLSNCDLVIRSGEYLKPPNRDYTPDELRTYERYVRAGGNLLLLADYLRPGEKDVMAELFGVRFRGSTIGPQFVRFASNHSISRELQNTSFFLQAGSALLQWPAELQILAHLDEASFADFDADGQRDNDEPTAPAVMGITTHGRGRIVFVGDVNLLNAVPQPMMDNLMRAYFPALRPPLH